MYTVSQRQSLESNTINLDLIFALPLCFLWVLSLYLTLLVFVLFLIDGKKGEWPYYSQLCRNRSKNVFDP